MGATMDWAFAVQCLVTLLAITDPIGSVPLFVAVTDQRAPAIARRIAWNATWTTFVTLVGFAFLGQGILHSLGVSLPAFRTGGGILLMFIAFPMLQGQMSPAKHGAVEAQDLAERESLGIVPLGIPLLAGPGAMSAATLFGQQASRWERVAGLAAAIVITALAVLVVFRMAPRIGRLLGRIGVAIANRIMGVILMAVGVQFIADGMRELFPMLGRG